MSLEAVLFDLDGTLLPMEQSVFVDGYFKSLSEYVSACGYEPEKLIDTIIKATYAMVDGDGKCCNENIFWDVFCSVYGADAIKDKAVFEKYYEEKFDCLKSCTSCNPKARETVDELKKMGIRLVLATNPLFPPLAIQKRLSWAGLSHKDFIHYTTYDNSSYCKPNPRYYEEILSKLNLSGENCIMAGNDTADDMVAESLGIKVFLMTDNLINKTNTDITAYPRGSFDELMKFIKENM